MMIFMQGFYIKTNMILKFGQLKSNAVQCNTELQTKTNITRFSPEN